MRHHATRCAALRPGRATPRRPWEGPTLLHPLFDPTCTARPLPAAPCPWERPLRSRSARPTTTSSTRTVAPLLAFEIGNARPPHGNVVASRGGDRDGLEVTAAAGARPPCAPTREQVLQKS
eukprot:1241058-Prymnesium_polylepis.1